MTLSEQTAMTATLLVTLLSACCALIEGENLLKNPSFEDPPESAWDGKRMRMEQYRGDKTHGQVSLLCKDRKGQLSGPFQTLPPSISPGRGYELRADVRLLNGNPKMMFQNFKAVMKFYFNETGPEEGEGGGGGGGSGGSDEGKAPICKRLRGEEHEKCLEQRRIWKAKAARRKEEKRKKMEARKKARQERRRKKGEQKKQRQRGKAKKKQEKKKGKEEKRKQRERKRKEQEKSREKKEREKERRKEKRERGRQKREQERKKQEGNRWESENGNRNNALRAPPDDIPSSQSGHLTDGDDALSAAGKRVRREGILRSPRPLSRQRRQQRRRRVERPTTILKTGKVLAPTDDQVVKPKSGITLQEGAYIIAWRAWVTPEQGWITLVGNINAPMISFNKVVLRIQGPDPGCDFLLDNVTLYEIPERSDWLTQSHVWIDRYRKANLALRVRLPPNIPRADIDIQVRLKRHLFAFGSKVEDKLLMNQRYRKFQELVFTLFNWATIGSFKWKFDKGPSLYSPDFSNALTALRILREHGLKIRGHSILWGVKKNIPHAVLATPPEQLPALLSFRTQHMINITRGRVEHWDVQNELLHGQWYEETMKDPNITLKVFKEARRLDPYPKLYLNDFTAVTSGANTEDYHDTALRFIQAGTGIQGLGIQGHTKQFVKPDPTMMWRRLDRLAETGLELFMTEFDLTFNDEEVRADWLEDAMRAFFAHPGLSGVILWGFWREMQSNKNKYLVYGEDLKFAEPGERFVCLIKKEWTTNETFNMASHADDFLSLRAFQGDYEVVVRRRGVPVQLKNFTLGKEDMAVTIDVTERSAPIEVREERDFVPQCISHRDRKSLGVLYTTSAEPNLACRDSIVDQSSVNSSSHVTVTCPEGKVMMDCSSLHQGRSSTHWRGQEIRVENGTATCAAPAAPYGHGSVRVSARCCQQKELTCDYRQAGPSALMPGAMAEARCPLGYITAGCSVFSEFSHINGVFPNNNLTACRAVNGLPSRHQPQYQSGVVSGAVCCKSQTLDCHVVMSAPGSQSDVTVTCPQGDVMSGCHVQAPGAGTAGSYIYTDSAGTATCTAVAATDHPEKGSGGGTIVAVAICCRP